MFERDFEKFIIVHGEKLFNLCHFAAVPENREHLFCRKFLGQFHLQAAWMEETLDIYGSAHNSTWSQLRKTAAAAKLFSSVCYDMLHVQKAAPHYHLLPIQADFFGDLKKTLDLLQKALVLTARELLSCLKRYASYEPAILSPESFLENYLQGRLKADLKVRRLPQTDKNLVYLATSFLNQSGDLEILDAGDSIKKKDYGKYIPGRINEENLRLVKAHFHNLQSAYDTYLSQTDVEHSNPAILSLRGHVSIVYHLLNSGEKFSHYYERHIMGGQGQFRERPFLPIPKNQHLSLLVDFYLYYAKMFFSAAKSLCKNIISIYSEKAEIAVPAPQYRGFHVRPSTLIAKIVLHYGSHVEMELDGEEYDASSPLELFRANEKINAAKRRFVNCLATSESLLDNLNKITSRFWPERIQLLILRLMDEGVIVLYEQNLSMKDMPPEEGESPKEYFQKIVARFLASGKIDIHKDISVVFRGDKRVLMDIKLLADQGYGEDKFGNNIMLPPQLSYLRRSG